MPQPFSFENGLLLLIQLDHFTVICCVVTIIPRSVVSTFESVFSNYLESLLKLVESPVLELLIP
jgi:hypothetical protein